MKLHFRLYLFSIFEALVSTHDGEGVQNCCPLDHLGQTSSGERTQEALQQKLPGKTSTKKLKKLILSKIKEII